MRAEPPPPGSNLPGDDEGLFARVYRWKEAVCMMSPGMFKAVAEMRRQLDRDVKNLFLAGGLHAGALCERCPGQRRRCRPRRLRNSWSPARP